ncbi:MAG TPA: EpsI family protein [Chthonomonas sp.]|jgi:hypothetical protein|uniref:EpsI family protein n=1 Tax=Chthonomonas sp. TaxID=2282153 RepID=UPI002B4B622A|nr:EpsI family protein [Chthonomonas sp.]HLH79110.1 EpsI family protein [Chthonomonas sp.]
MQQRRYSFLICALLLLGLGANLGFGRLKFATPHPVPIENFPRHIGDWVCVADDPVDPAVQKALPTATIIQREYRDPLGHVVTLELITGKSYDDFHDPNVCFPAQGWTLFDHKILNWNGQEVNFMKATLNGYTEDFAYYLAGGYLAQIPMGGIAQKKFYAWRKLLTGEGGGSLVVRMSNTEGPGSVDVLKRFALTIQPIVNALVKEKR